MQGVLKPVLTYSGLFYFIQVLGCLIFTGSWKMHIGHEVLSRLPMSLGSLACEHLNQIEQSLTISLYTAACQAVSGSMT
jgi:hypothetical protein